MRSLFLILASSGFSRALLGVVAGAATAAFGAVGTAGVDDGAATPAAAETGAGADLISGFGDTACGAAFTAAADAGGGEIDAGLVVLTAGLVLAGAGITALGLERTETAGDWTAAATSGAAFSGAFVCALRKVSVVPRPTAITANSVAAIATFLLSSRKSIKPEWRSTD